MFTRLQIQAGAILSLLGICMSYGIAGNPPKGTKPTTAATNQTPAAAPAGQSNTAAPHKHHSVLANVLRELHEAKHLLHTGMHVAHHHRAKANEEIAKAIHILEHHHHHAHHSATTTAHHSKGATAPQGAPTVASLKHADEKLRHAEKLVHASEHQLHQIHHGETHHELHQASHHLKEAAHHIRAAMHEVTHLEKTLASK